MSNQKKDTTKIIIISLLVGIFFFFFKDSTYIIGIVFTTIVSAAMLHLLFNKLSDNHGNEHVIQVKQTSKDQISEQVINSIMESTNNAINKIYNILVVTSIYLTIMVVTFSLFQYSKIIEADKMEENFDNKLKEITKESEIKINALELELLHMQWSNAFNNQRPNASKLGVENFKKIFEDIIPKYPEIVDEERLPFLYNDYGLALLTTNFAKSEEMFLKALDLQKSSTERAAIYLNLGDLMNFNRQIDKAISYYNKGIEENPNDFILLPQITLALNRRNKNGDIENAYNLIESYFVKYPDNVELFLREVFITDAILNIETKYPNLIEDLYNNHPEITRPVLKNIDLEMFNSYKDPFDIQNKE